MMPIRRLFTAFLLSLLFLVNLAIFSPVPGAIAAPASTPEARSYQVKEQPHTSSDVHTYPNTGSLDDDGKTKQERIEDLADDAEDKARNPLQEAIDTVREKLNLE